MSNSDHPVTSKKKAHQAVNDLFSLVGEFCSDKSFRNFALVFQHGRAKMMIVKKKTIFKRFQLSQAKMVSVQLVTIKIMLNLGVCHIKDDIQSLVTKKKILRDRSSENGFERFVTSQMLFSDFMY